MQRQRLFNIAFAHALALLSFFGTGRAQAGPITYLVTVDTSTLSGSSGYLDFEFNPGGLGAALADATITNFSPAANLHPLDPNNSISGDVTGSLTSMLTPLTFDNGTAFNDFFEAFTYGNSIGFDVKLSGPALNSSGGSPLDAIGSSFAFSLYDSTGTVPLLTTDPNGSVLTVNVNGNGSTSVETFAQSAGDSTPAASAVPSASSVPAPPSIVLFILAAPVGLIHRRRSRLPLSKAPS